MDWLARSIANSLNLHDAGDGDDEDDKTVNATDPKSPPPNQILEDNQHRPINSPPPSSSPRGVKEDISDLTKSLTRQFWGVASFLAPPPSDQSKARDPSDPEVAEEDLIAGIRSDFAEISGKFKTGISKLSTNIAVSDITKIASNFLQIGSEQDAVDQDLVGNAVGVTEEVLAFARNLAMHPETWLHFPVPDYEYFDDFDMSDAQQEHALAVERLVQRLAALRIELCPGYMSEGCFWKIYFVLLHPRLDKHDAELLSTPQIVEARAMLMQELQNRNKANPEADLYGMGSSYSKGSADSPREVNLSVPSSAQSESAPLKTSIIEAAPSTAAVDFETEKHPIQSAEVQIVDKSVVEEEPVKRSTIEHSQSSSSKISDEKYEDDGDDWLKEESSGIVGLGGTTVPLGNDDDVSFSDLEDDDDGDAPTSYKKVTYGSDSSTKDSRDWVQLSRSSTDSLKDSSSASIKQIESEQVSARNLETKESNDWLNVDDIDVL